MTSFNTHILNPAWVTAFIDGEGTFYVGIYKKNDMKMGYQVTLEFSITQHIRDIELMNQLPLFFGCGYLAPDGPTKMQFRIRSVKDIQDHLLPLLDAYPLLSQKGLDSAAFREVHALILAKAHLTTEGLAQIRSIKSTMNRARMAKYKV